MVQAMDIECIEEYDEIPHRKSADTNKDKGAAEDRKAHACDQKAALPVLTTKLTSNCRILIVDDDESVRETLADLLEIVGYSPLQAADALEALMILRQETNVDALVTDLTMPGADGITLIRHAREIRPELPAILLTGYAEEVASVATIAGGNFHVLRKPVESARLIEQLELLVKKSPNT
jgi:CheY-like chemotaxis protein